MSPRAPKIDSFTVQAGHSRFPLDMLRYDGCTPDRSEDATAIEGLITGPPLHGEVVTIRLRSYTGNVTAARWNSFGWRVVGVNGGQDPFRWVGAQR